MKRTIARSSEPWPRRTRSWGWDRTARAAQGECVYMGCRNLRFHGSLRICILILGLSVFAMMPATGRAQVTASITGSVEDATGAVVRDATITVKSQETGATRAVTTDDSG